MKNKAWSVLRIADSKFKLAYQDIILRDLKEGELLISLEYSSINYRDMLGSKGNLGVARSFPYYPGVDAAGIVIESTSERIPKGSKVFVAAVSMNKVYPGCWSQNIIAKEEVVSLIPGKLSTRDIMIFGTAGLSAALGVMAINRFVGGIHPKQKMLVTGASGGLGSLATAILSSYGCSVDVVSRKTDRDNYFLSVGASRVLSPYKFILDSGPNLLKEEYTGVVDTLGGEVLVAAIKRTVKFGVVACSGLVESQRLNLTVLPFLMRGVALIGTGAEISSTEVRLEAWALLEKHVSSTKLDLIGNVIKIENVPEALEQMSYASHQGRFVIKIA